MLFVNTDNLLLIIVALVLIILAVSVFQQLQALFQNRDIARQPATIKEVNTYHHGRGRPNERR